MQARPLGGSDQNAAGLIADGTPKSLAAGTQCRFIGFFSIAHTITSEKCNPDRKKRSIYSIIILIKVPRECIEKFSC